MPDRHIMNFPPKLHQRPVILAEPGLHCELAVPPLRQAGFVIETAPLAQMAERLDSGAYNLLILARFFLPRHRKQEEIAVMRRLTEAVLRFLEKGGGVWLNHPSIDVIPMDNLLPPCGGEFLRIGIEVPGEEQFAANAQIFTRARVVRPLGGRARTIWYPVKNGQAVVTRPLMLAPREEWSVFVEGSERSHTRRLEQEGYGLPGQDVPGHDHCVPLVAGRVFGAGRLILCGIPAGEHLYAPHVYPPARRLLVEGYDQTPSDLQAYLLDAFHWLAAPSLQAGVSATRDTEESVLRPQIPRYPDDPPVIWANREFPPDSPAKSGLIGLRSTHSTGSLTTAEYVRKARAAGLDFVVFLEEFSALQPGGFARLKEECEVLSDDDFLAVPGYTLRDVVGSRSFQYGYTIDLPSADLLSTDGSRLSNQPGDTFRNGRIDNTHCSLIFGELKMRGRRGGYLHKDTPKHFSDQRFHDSIALVTWEKGTVIEDVRDRYFTLMDKGLRLNPVVLTFVENDADFASALASGWRTGLLEPYASIPEKVIRRHMAPELEWWGCMDEKICDSPRYRFDCWQYGLPFQYLTEGPAIASWVVSVSGRNGDWRAPDTEIPPVGDPFRVDALGFRLRLRATSPSGLSDIRLMDGDREIRRWQAGGEQEFEMELDLVHHQQMHLMLEVRDRDGRRAIISDYLAFRLDWCEFFCADRNNPLQIGYEKAPDGTAYGWAGTEYLTYNNGQWGGTSPWTGRWWFNKDALHPAPRSPLHDVTAPCDGGVGSGAPGLRLQYRIPDLDPPEYGLMIDSGQKLISPDVTICDFVSSHGYDHCAPYFFGTDSTGFGLFGSWPTRYFHIERRLLTFRPLPGALTTLVCEHKLSFKADPGLRGPLQAGLLDPADEWVFHPAARGKRSLSTLAAGETLSWQPGDFLLAWTGGARPAIFLNDGCPLLLQKGSPDGDPFSIWIAEEQLPKVGSSIPVRLLAFGGTVNHRNGNIVRVLARAMGLQGAPGYQVTCSAGRVLSTRLFLELDGAAYGVALAIPRVKLPMALPVIVRGLYDAWPVFLVDRISRRWRPLGVLEGTTYATLDSAQGDSEIFIGHPYTADHPGVFLSLVQVGGRAWRLEMHNPTSELLSATITRSNHFDLTDWPGGNVTLAPGTSCFRDLVSA